MRRTPRSLGRTSRTRGVRHRLGVTLDIRPYLRDGRIMFREMEQVIR